MFYLQYSKVAYCSRADLGVIFGLVHYSRQQATKPSLPNPSEAVLFENSHFARGWQNIDWCTSDRETWKVTKLMPKLGICSVSFQNNYSEISIFFQYCPCSTKSPISFRSLFWFDLGLHTFHENSNHGR